MKRTLIYLTVFLAMTVAPFLAGASTLTWNTDKLLETSDAAATYPQVAISGNNAVAVWVQSDGVNDRIYASYSANAGATWSSAVLIDPGSLGSFSPQVAIDGSNVVVVWPQYDGTRNYIYSNYSINGGATWLGAKMIEEHSTPNTNQAQSPKVVINSNNVVAVWAQSDGTKIRIYSNYSTDAGATWSSAVLIDNGGSSNIQVAIDGSNVVVVWEQFDSNYRIYSNYSTDSGQTWEGAASIENDSSASARYPWIAISGNNVVAIWIFDTDYIYTNSAEFSGGILTWTHANSQRIDNQVNFPWDSLPRVSISGNNVVAVWGQTDNGTGYYTYTAYSSDAGATWSADQLLQADNTVSTGNPQVAISGSNVTAVWKQQQLDLHYAVYSRHSFDGGANWSTPALIEDNSGYSAEYPQVAISGNNVVAVWQQDTGGSSNSIYSNYATFAASTTDLLGGGCFIATVAFGSPLAGQVEILRQFRDRYLLTNTLGQKFVAWYYRNGPAAASYIEDKPLAKAAVRLALYPLIGFSFLLIAGYLPFVMVGLLFCTLVFFRFRPKKLVTA